MRKTSLFFLGAGAGALFALLAIQPRILLGAPAEAAGSDTYRQLNLFGDIFEHVRAQYVEKPDDAKLVEAAINGMLTSLDPHSAFLDAKNFRDTYGHNNCRGRPGRSRAGRSLHLVSRRSRREPAARPHNLLDGKLF